MKGGQGAKGMNERHGPKGMKESESAGASGEGVPEKVLLFSISSSRRWKSVSIRRASVRVMTFTCICVRCCDARGRASPARLVALAIVDEHKIVMVGLDNAGKTTILYQLLMNEVVHTSPTIGSNVEEVVWKNLHFIMWDLGGQESLRSAWNTYYTNTEFVILVIDSTDRERLSITREELYKMLAHEELSRAAVLIYANKQDVKGSMSAAEISRLLNLTSIKKHKWQIQGCCALTGEGLYQGLEWIGSTLKSK
ncbi:ADP-ribosylation factor-like protein 5B [Penaeus vannamei]